MSKKFTEEELKEHVMALTDILVMNIQTYIVVTLDNKGYASDLISLILSSFMSSLVTILNILTENEESFVQRKQVESLLERIHLAISGTAGTNTWYA